MDYMGRYREWVEKLPKDDPLQEELAAIEGDHREIRERADMDAVGGEDACRKLRELF